MNPFRVFLVEDSLPLRTRISDDIAAMGRFELVGFAETQDEAVAAIERLCPDVVITDLQLRLGTGLQVVLQISTGQCSPVPHIIVLTNYAFPEYKRQCLVYGANEFFDKSSEYGQFLSSMRQLN